MKKNGLSTDITERSSIFNQVTGKDKNGRESDLENIMLLSWGAEKTLKVAKENEIDFVILKERSPSCGNSYIYDGSFSGKVIQGQGFTARKLNEENIVIFSEENLEEIEKYLEELNK